MRMNRMENFIITAAQRIVRNHRVRVVYLCIRSSGWRNIQTVRSRSRCKVKREFVVLDHAHEKIHSGIKGNRKLVNERIALELGTRHFKFL